MTEQKKQMGRPKKEIDQEKFEEFCGYQCTLEEIASFFSCSPDTIERWVTRTYNTTFADIFSQKRKKGLISLRRRQYEVALAGSIPMLIFLGKNYLGQSDKIEQTVHGASEITLAYQPKSERLNKEDKSKVICEVKKEIEFNEGEDNA